MRNNQGPKLKLERNVKKFELITNELNVVLKKIGAITGEKQKQILNRLNIPTTHNKCSTKQISGFISRVKQELKDQRLK